MGKFTNSRRRKLVAGVAGAALAGTGAWAATNWAVGVAAGSSAEGQSATISNLTITAVSAPAAGNLLYPGGTGDAVLKITNPNSFPVTITAVNLPTNTTYAAGFSDNALTVSNTGCTAATPSGVTWNFATATSGSVHTLTSALTVAANGSLTVTMTNDASMASTTPAACVNTYFQMPALTGIAATGGAATATVSPATDSWIA